MTSRNLPPDIFDGTIIAVSTNAAFRALDVGTTKGTAKINEGVLKSVLIGRSRRVLVESIREVLENGAPLTPYVPLNPRGPRKPKKRAEAAPSRKNSTPDRNSPEATPPAPPTPAQVPREPLPFITHPKPIHKK
jgi:hypothetical protein